MYIRKGESIRKGIEKREKKLEGRTLKEESEHYYFSYRLSLLGRTSGELDSHLFLNINLIFPSCCPHAKPSVFVRSLLLQILLIWARVERHGPLL